MSLRAGATALGVFALAFLAAGAGGLPLPPVLALGGIIAFPAALLAGAFRRQVPWELLAVAAFVLWVGASALWSDYDRPDTIVKFLIGAPLYAAFAAACFQIEGPWRARAEAAFLFCAFALALLLLSEALTGGALLTAFKTAVEGYPPGDQHTINLVNRSLGHAAAPLVLMAGPAAALAWREGGPVVGVALLALAALAAFAFNTHVNVLALILALAAAGAALWRPRAAVAGLFGTLASLFVVLPVIMPALVAAVPAGLRAALPMSWEWRLKIWDFTSERLREKLWTGWGFDASRVLEGEAQLRGQTIQLLSLHPHNAPLQIWLETGAVGAMLLAFALVLIGGRIGGARRLTRLQAASVAWVAAAFTGLILAGYGVWQEWLLAALALAAAGLGFLGSRREAGQ